MNFGSVNGNALPWNDLISAGMEVGSEVEMTCDYGNVFFIKGLITSMWAE